MAMARNPKVPTKITVELQGYSKSDLIELVWELTVHPSRFDPRHIPAEELIVDWLRGIRMAYKEARK